MKRFLVFSKLYVLGLVLLFSCTEDKSGTNMRINHHWDAGVGEGSQLVLLIQQGNKLGSTEWEKLYSPIEGFVFEPGKIYNLQIETSNVENPVADGSSLRYTLKQIISTEAVGNDVPFEMVLKGYGLNFVTTSDGSLKILDQITLDCDTLCADLETALLEKSLVTGIFTHQSTGGVKLQSFK